MKFSLRFAFSILAVSVGTARFSTTALAQNFLSQFPLRKETKYFDFRYKHDSPRLTKIVRFDDAFIEVVTRDFFKADFDYPIHAVVLEDEDQFKEFLQNQYHIPDPRLGIYVPSDKLFATYEASGLGTFTHEILHALVERDLSSRPAWALEGIPTFFEKFYGYWRGDQLVLLWGFQNPWRIDGLGARLTRLDLKEIISEHPPRGGSGAAPRNESEVRMVSVFLWQRGKFRRFLRLISEKDKHGYPSYFEAAMEMPLERIIPLWQIYLQDVARRRTSILSLPSSTVFDSEGEFQRFAKLHNMSTQQTKQLN